MATFIAVVVGAFFAFITGYGIGWDKGFLERDKIAKEFKNKGIEMTTQDISRIVAEMREHVRVLRKMRDDVAGLIADYNRPRFEQRDLLEQQAALHAAIDAMQFRAEAITQQPGNAVPDGDELRTEIDRLNAIINTPQADDFLKAVSTEAEHQRQRWGSDHDAGKTPADWFWLIGYLAGKALHCTMYGMDKKAEHHVITTAAACANWHRAMLGMTNMRPGIDGESLLAAAEGQQP